VIPKRALALWLVLAATACGTLSTEEEKKLGQQAQREVREHFVMMRDRVVVNYVRDVGRRMVEASDPSAFEFRFYVVEDEEINAFALPGGAIYVHTGTIAKAADAAELAGVLAHEIGHVTARHVAQLYRRQRNTGVAAQVAALAVGILTGNPYLYNAAGLGASVAATAYTSQFGREAERQADALAVEAMIRAGYDPNALGSFFRTLMEESRTGGLKAPEFLRSHPATEERIANVTALIRSHPPFQATRRDDGGRFEIIQKRIALVEGMDTEGEVEAEPEGKGRQ
jgi:predicted Zn-dependent protease